MDNVHKKQIKNIYLTYKGVLKVLFCSRTGRAEQFIDWATKTLFTAQTGKVSDKIKLASDLIGADLEAVKIVFNTAVRKVPCVYLIILEDLKSKKGIVVKYGMTQDLNKRIKQHTKTFGKVSLKYRSYLCI